MTTTFAENQHLGGGFAGGKLRRVLASGLETFALILIICFIMVPIVWLALTAIKPQEKAYTTDIIFPPTVDNFRIIFSDTSVIINEGTRRERGEVGRNMLPNVFNSVIVSGATILIAIPLATIAAYAFSRYLFLGNRVAFGLDPDDAIHPGNCSGDSLFHALSFDHPLWQAPFGVAVGLDHRQLVDCSALRHLDDQRLCRCPAH